MVADDRSHEVVAIGYVDREEEWCFAARLGRGLQIVAVAAFGRVAVCGGDARMAFADLFVFVKSNRSDWAPTLVATSRQSADRMFRFIC